MVVSEFGKKAYFSIIFFVFFLLDFFVPRPCYPRLVSSSLSVSLTLVVSAIFASVIIVFLPIIVIIAIFSYFAKTKFIYLGKRIFHVHASDYSSSSLHPQSVVCTYKLKHLTQFYANFPVKSFSSPF